MRDSLSAFLPIDLFLPCRTTTFVGAFCAGIAQLASCFNTASYVRSRFVEVSMPMIVGTFVLLTIVNESPAH